MVCRNLCVLIYFIAILNLPARSVADQSWVPVETAQRRTSLESAPRLEITTGFFKTSSNSNSGRLLTDVANLESKPPDADSGLVNAPPSRASRKLQPAATKATSPSKRLQACINANQPHRNVTTWQMVTDEEATNITVSHIVWSKRSPPSRIPLTITTQLSINRLHQLEAQCRAWAGPISAVAYLAIIQHVDHNSKLPDRVRAAHSRTASALQSAKLEVNALHRKMELQNNVCRLDIMLVYEILDKTRTSMLHPVNVLRNFARLQARTPLIGLFDVDMLVSSALAVELDKLGSTQHFSGLNQPVADHEQPQVMAASGPGLTPGVDSSSGSGSGSGAPLRSLMAVQGKLWSQRRGPAPPKVALVLPAFVMSNIDARQGAEEADRAVLYNKTKVRAFFRTNNMSRFDPKGEGHRATNYSRWFDATKSYPVTYTFRYEPWVIVDRLSTPWYDARFRGYGQNKIIHLESLNVSGYTFQVHPDAFLVHRSHDTSRAKLQHATDFRNSRNSSTFRSTVYGAAAALGKKCRDAMAVANYTAVLHPATQACMHSLPWWGGGGGGAGGGRRTAKQPEAGAVG